LPVLISCCGITQRGLEFFRAYHVAGWLFAFCCCDQYLNHRMAAAFAGTNRWTAVALNLILGGALGNLIDRIHHGLWWILFKLFPSMYIRVQYCDPPSPLRRYVGIEILFFKKKAECVINDENSTRQSTGFVQALTALLLS